MTEFLQKTFQYVDKKFKQDISISKSNTLPFVGAIRILKILMIPIFLWLDIEYRIIFFSFETKVKVLSPSIEFIDSNWTKF